MSAETLTAQYPCCGKACRITANPALPVERIERRHWCAADDETGTLYEVTRTALRNQGGIRIDRVDFLDLASSEAVAQYGRKRFARRTVTP